MLYPNLKAVYRKGTLKLQKPLKIPEGATVQVSVQTAAQGNSEHVMKFAGAWDDMPDDVFDDFFAEVGRRRQLAFSRRRGRETISD
jgi:predicted DNA-binding antitoxin AbrB/MazE fold protein